MKPTTIIATALLLSTPAVSVSSNKLPIEIAVDKCLQKVHEIPPPAYDLMGNYYRSLFHRTG